ncbi:MAG: ferredoxin--NADP reductase [Gammaproteobacteria bacterium]|nr:ferredoxin--NADP reductase [Gammaproteobacteria bacterium]
MTTLKWAEMISQDVRHLAFAKTGEPLLYKPGQFISLHFDHQGQKLKRSYSIATAPNQDGLIEIAVSYIPGGPASELLFGLKPGDRLETTGPYGRFVLPDHSLKNTVLIATGTGITPYLAMLPELEKRIACQNAKVTVLFGCKSREHLLYGQRFIEFSKRFLNFTFLSCYSRQFPLNPEAFERRGHVQEVLDEIRCDPTSDMVYLCGNPNMVDDVFSRLKAQKFAIHQIRREKYISGT